MRKRGGEEEGRRRRGEEQDEEKQEKTVYIKNSPKHSGNYKSFQGLENIFSYFLTCPRIS